MYLKQPSFHMQHCHLGSIHVSFQIIYKLLAHTLRSLKSLVVIYCYEASYWYHKFRPD
uniref:Uncharacterized protein n=1 Tax=Octopus bimaculoides TaxID=37653 RepID=A0A0L8GVU9_OCTBM